MKKVLVLGATGAMGRYLVPELVKLNYEVTGVGLEDAALWSLPGTVERKEGVSDVTQGDIFLRHSAR